MARFGAHLGTAFQIADDVLDYEGDADSIGKNLGDDLAEGKLTLPIIRALEICNPAQRETLRQAIVARDHTRLSSVLSVLHDLDAIAYARNAAAKEAQTALAELAVLEDSPAKQLLLMCCNYAVERQQ
jgi:octaprenyl-diphosphate synthase